MREEFVNRLLRSCVNAIIDIPNQAIRGGQSVPLPQGPNVVVNFLSSRKEGQDHKEYRTTGEELGSTITTDRAWLYSINVIENTASENDGFLPDDMDTYESAFDIAHDLQLGFSKESILEVLREGNVGILRRTNPRNLSSSSVAGGGSSGFYEQRFTFDIELHVQGTVGEVLTAIERLTIAGSVGSADIDLTIEED